MGNHLTLNHLTSKPPTPGKQKLHTLSSPIAQVSMRTCQASPPEVGLPHRPRSPPSCRARPPSHFEEQNAATGGFFIWLWVKTQETPGEHQNKWQMDVHPPQNGAIGYGHLESKNGEDHGRPEEVFWVCPRGEASPALCQRWKGAHQLETNPNEGERTSECAILGNTGHRL